MSTHSSITSLFPLASLKWQFRECTPRSPWRLARVPGCVHTDLLHHDLIPNPYYGTNELRTQWIEERDWEYQASFDLPENVLAEQHLELVSDGLDTLATVTLNGTVIARTENMFVGYRWDVRELLRPRGNHLLIRFDSPRRFIDTHRLEHKAPLEFNDPVGGCTRLRKQQCQFGWDWAPRTLTSGIWRDIRIEGWSNARLADVRIQQDHTKRGQVALHLEPEFAGSGKGLSLHASLHLNGEVVADAEGLNPTLIVRRPQLWWPAGHGDQPLYTLHVALRDASSRVVSTWQRQIGLRTIVLDRHPDQWGESFQFVVNGRPIFIKGANWIPADNFVAGLTRKDYARDLYAAVAANMNCVRVWGGGVYESEDFYDLCDELGLLVWQDFMFACSLYPGDRAFVNSVRDEAEYQVARLRHRACLALWCGNNEVAQINHEHIKKSPTFLRNYEKVFHKVLPEVVNRVDGVTAYWPSSEWRGDYRMGHAEGEKRGDTHFWDVWHMRKPVSDYEKWKFRFCSEFGMQSYASPETIRAFCPPGERNLFGATSENHQKNPAGNQIILDYVSRRYGFPKNQDSLIYLSQLNQAYCMQTAVEHYRRNMPQCMGALYWQLNDCWPVASWSSIEHSGRWKALHHVARRFFAPALISAHVIGEEKQGKNNYRENSISRVDLYTAYDAPTSANGTIRWRLCHLDGRVISKGSKDVPLRYGNAKRQLSLDFGPDLAKHDRDSLYLAFALEVEGDIVSRDTAFFASPRFLRLPKAKVKATVTMVSRHEADIRFEASAFQHRFFFDLPGLDHQAEDNFFELYPKETYTVRVEFAEPTSKASISAALTHQSLVDLLAND